MKIFDSLLGLLPSWVPFAAIGVLAIGLAGGFFALKATDPQSEAVLAEWFPMAQTLPR